MAKPKIRFNGYTEDWEQRKVGELLEERNEQAPMSEDYPLMAFIANQGVAPKGERYDRSALVNDETGKKYKRTEFGDFIYSSNNLETGSIGLNKYGNACISPVYSIFKPTGKAELDFLGRRFLRKDFINEMVRWRQGVVYGQWKIHETDFMKIEVRIPSVDEQKKIGQYFDSLDNLITLHQRKCEQTKTLKKYMLQKMFPQDGEKVPQIRFEGFTEDWEQRKLGEVVKEGILEAPLDGNHGEKHPTSDEYVESGIPFLMASDIHNGEVNIYSCKYITKERAERLDKGFARNGDVLLTHKATIGETAILSNLMTEYAMLTPQVTYYRIKNEERLNREYLYSFFNSLDFQTELKTKAAQSTRPYIGITAQQNLKIILPSEIDEQRKIGLYFENLDRLITLHQRKCDELKEVKKFMLQNMFV